ncbi:MAG: GNAT family N-acetyltransferase [Longispora sp.]|nr:GNAT family N-acetyltransferase [Longispora sp. (in: high G+C Gram-positive bacteria)]
MTDVLTAHTSQLDTKTLDAARALLFEAFHGDIDENDWEHSLGGIHALVWEGGELIGHGSVIQRRLIHNGQALRTGYVEGLGVRTDRQGRGHGAALMNALEHVIRGAYDIGALGASDEAISFYAARGWRLWQGQTSALTPNGIQHTPGEDGCIYVLPLGISLDFSGEMTCDWRGGDVW